MQSDGNVRGSTHSGRPRGQDAGLRHSHTHGDHGLDPGPRDHGLSHDDDRDHGLEPGPSFIRGPMDPTTRMLQNTDEYRNFRPSVAHIDPDKDVSI